MSDLESSSTSSFLNISEPSFSQPSIIQQPDNDSIGVGSDEFQDDLPSEPDSDDATISDEDDERDNEAEREWKESMQQLELLLTMVLVPYLGKYFGRKFAYWGWKQFMEWKYPVQVVFTSPGTFKAAGVVGAAASL